MIKEEDGLIEYLEKILKNIDDKSARGIAQLAIDKGISCLSDKQKYVLEKGISDYLMYECPICGEEISYEDMEIAIYNGMCSCCNHRLESLKGE